MTTLLQKMRKRPHEKNPAGAFHADTFSEEDRHPPGVQVFSMPRPEAAALQSAKNRVQGHGEQRVVPDDCQFGDNDLCNGET